MEEEPSQLKYYLQQLSSINRNHLSAKGYAYTSMHELVLTHGLDMEHRRYDSADYGPLGTIKECYANATRLVATNPNLVYCEGFACSIIPVPHAWCWDRTTERVVDPTWREPCNGEKRRFYGAVKEATYFGIPLCLEYVHKVILQTGTFGVLDQWETGFPIFKGKPGHYAIDFIEREL